MALKSNNNLKKTNNNTKPNKKNQNQWSEVTSATQTATKSLGDRKMRASGDRPWKTLTCWAPIRTTVDDETQEASSNQAARRQTGLQIKKVSATEIDTQLQCS